MELILRTTNNYLNDFIKMQIIKLAFIFIFLLFVSCNGDAQKIKTETKKESKQLNVNFSDKKFDNLDFSLIIDESNISDHPVKSFLDYKDEGYFTIHYIPKTENLRKFWKEDYLKNFDSDNIDLKKESQKIHKIVNKSHDDYEIFAYSINKEFLASNGACTEENTYAKKNTNAQIYHYQANNKQWKLVKELNSDRMPPYYDNDFFTNNFPSYFTLETKVQSIKSDHWNGSYSLTIDYGKLDDLSEMSIDYDIEIKNSECTFSGMGYKTYFTDLCKVEEKGDKLILKYIKSVDGDGFTDHSKVDIVAEIVYKNNQYYIKSPVIADANWKYNSELLLTYKK